jgi:putative tryptophan/tyrosine transport system substrate-binding protein
MSWTRPGAFMSYAPARRDVCRKAAGYVDRILKGQTPSELPVEQPTKFGLMTNLRTPQALGLEVSPMLLTAMTR